ncbi:MAG TPA: hypothetical protein RMH99_30375 [Sandaracinaceae bacterium LLY-WYZ-13_1]|nr:hypothetical protein [Sandaracinaceae bacterium LLY-WYZ-13_1]
MRRTLPFAFALVSFVAGCGDPDAGKLFVDIQYATRCDETLGCGGTEERDICGINQGDPCIEGTPEVLASCSVSESESNRTVSFSAQQGADFSIAVSGAIFPFAGGSASGGSCTVTVVDGPNTYSGACGSSEPSEAQPCQISSVMFYDDMGNPTVEGSILCKNLSNRANPDLQIEVSTLGSGPDAANTPAGFRLANCTGLEVEGE